MNESEGISGGQVLSSAVFLYRRDVAHATARLIVLSSEKYHWPSLFFHFARACHALYSGSTLPPFSSFHNKLIMTTITAFQRNSLAVLSMTPSAICLTERRIWRSKLSARENLSEP